MSIKCLDVVLCFALAAFSTNFAYGKEDASGMAATIAEARAVLDLSGSPLIEAEGQAQTQLAFQFFNAVGNVSTIGKAIDQALVSRGLKQLAGATFTDEYGSATYEKSGYHVRLIVGPLDETNNVMITVINNGNVDLNLLPKPQGAIERWTSPSAGMYVCDLSVEEAKKSCRELLERDGWEWFGDATFSFFMRKNAVRLEVLCSPSPTEQGTTDIQYSTDLMSAALPLISNLVRISYAGSDKQLDGDSKLSTDELFNVYRKTLEAAGWKATTDNPIKIDFREHLIFRNAQKESAELIVHPFESLSRFTLTFMTADEVDAENKRVEVAVAAAMKKRVAEQTKMNNPTKTAIDKPEAGTLTTSEKQVIEFSVKSGTAQSVATKWIAEKAASGWTVEKTIQTQQVGEYKLKKGETTLSLSFVDPGFIPGTITIQATGPFELDLKK